jgi:selenocysteine lyase/cysteine desulfurase
MLIATNKLRSEVLLRFFHEEEDEPTKPARKMTDLDDLEEKPVEVKKEVPISYPENTSNKSDNFNPFNHDRAEIDYYNKSVFSNIERRQCELSKKYQDKLKRLIEMERLTISNTIADRTVIQQFKDQKAEALMMCLESNVDKRLDLSKETERKIRMNKINKNRN